jgi:hypothetical protein
MDYLDRLTVLTVQMNIRFLCLAEVTIYSAIIAQQIFDSWRLDREFVQEIN